MKKDRNQALFRIVLSVVGLLWLTASVAFCEELAKLDNSDQSGAKAVEERFQDFYVYTEDSFNVSHFAPSGWMGDTQDIKFSGANPNESNLGNTCLRVTYLARGKKEWAGVYWQNPPNNWGNATGGYNLGGAKYLTFWAKGEKGGEKISEFKMGGLTGKNPDSDTAWIGPVKLRKEWRQYKISLRGKNLKYIIGGFCFTVLAVDNPSGCTFYLDEIKYE
ncbi:MAG: hypothetical protein JW803_06540 [Endomicrobiales bacterium]|nr:hypothetical protein [Endomicrobiales bacterium]